METRIERIEVDGSDLKVVGISTFILSGGLKRTEESKVGGIGFGLIETSEAN